MSKINIALCGIGGYARLYTNYILDANDQRICPVGVVDPYPNSCPRLAELKEAGIPVYDTLEALYADHQVDLTVITTPIHLHTNHICTALAAGSHVLCEKPLCAHENDIAVLLDAQAKSGKTVSIGYQWSWSEAILALKADILNGKFGACQDVRTMVLWPRDFAYYKRGSGWAGKILTPDGTPVYDSIANNATAHYLHNLLYLLGKPGCALLPETICGELYRANDIENYDTCKVNMTLPGGVHATYLASHATSAAVNPLFHLRFTDGEVYYSQNKTDLSAAFAPDWYGDGDYNHIVAMTKSGEKRDYGSPFADELRKLKGAIALASGETDTLPCGIETASAHTKVINWLQHNCPIRSFRDACICRTEEKLWVDGLTERMTACWENPGLGLDMGE